MWPKNIITDVELYFSKAVYNELINAGKKSGNENTKEARNGCMIMYSNEERKTLFKKFDDLHITYI